MIDNIRNRTILKFAENAYNTYNDVESGWDINSVDAQKFIDIATNIRNIYDVEIIRVLAPQMSQEFLDNIEV